MLIYLQSSVDSDPFGELRGGVYSLFEPLHKLLLAVMVIAAIVIGVRMVLNVINGKTEASQKLLYWLLGLIFGYVMMEVLIKYFTT